MKWLNIITDSEEFTEVIYELFNSEEDFEKYSKTTDLIKNIYNEKSELFQAAINKINKYCKRSKKKVEEVYAAESSEDYYISFTAIDPKVKSEVESLNLNWVYTSRLNYYLTGYYEFTEKDIELMPEIKDIEFPKDRFVNAVNFQVKTSWDKLHIPESLRHTFIAAMIMNTIQEEIV